MSEGNHSNVTSGAGSQLPNSTGNAPAKKRGLMIPVLAGTTVAVLAAGVIFQIMQAEPAAAVGENEQQTAATQKRTPQSLARINGQFITYEEVARECFARIGEEVLENIINRTIIQQEAKKRGVVISEAEVNQEVASIAKDFNLPVDTWYQMLQTERGISPAQYRRDIIWPKLALEKLAGSDVKITQKDMDQAFLRDYGPRVRCRWIVLDNFRRANDVLVQAERDPENFDKLAQENSIEPQSRALGGAFPPIQRTGDPYRKRLEDTAFRMKPGEISGLIEIGTSKYAILKCEGHTEPIVTDIKEVWNELYAQLEKEKTQTRVADVFETLKKQTRVDNYLTNRSTGGNTGNAAASGNYPQKIQQTSGRRTGQPAGQVRPAAGTQSR